MQVNCVPGEGGGGRARRCTSAALIRRLATAKRFTNPRCSSTCRAMGNPCQGTTTTQPPHDEPDKHRKAHVERLPWEQNMPCCHQTAMESSSPGGGGVALRLLPPPGRPPTQSSRPYRRMQFRAAACRGGGCRTYLVPFLPLITRPLGSAPKA